MSGAVSGAAHTVDKSKSLLSAHSRSAGEDGP